MLPQSRSLFLALLASLAASAVPVGAWAQAGPPQDRYIVVLNPDAGMPEDIAADVALRTNGRIGYVYQHALQGFSITMPRAAARGIARDPRVAYVEEDLPVSIVEQTLPTGLDRIYEPGILNGDPDNNSAGAASIDTALSIDGVDDWRVDAAVAVLDTGIDREHPDLNVVGGANCLKYEGKGPPWARSYFCDATETGDDDHYHGTHVAGTIGALDNGRGVVGVAPGVRLYAVKVLDSGGSGYTSGIIAGIDWVAARDDIDVINMSLGGSGVNQAYETAIANAVANGVVVVVAAGNSDADANNYSPAFADSAITVSALADFDGISGGNGAPTCRSDVDDTLADFSNWGSAVDIIAPGVCIYSTYPIEKGSYGTISGTSMASPHVAGAAALLASTGMAVADIRSALIGSDNGDPLNWIDDSGDGFKEPLLDISTFAPVLVVGPGNGGNTAPTASFTHAACVAGQSCAFDGSGSSDIGGTIVSYAWDFGGTDSTGEAASHVFPSSGDYWVTLTVTDNDGATGDDTQSVTVSPSDPGTGDACDGQDDGVYLTPSATSHGKTWTATVDALNCVGSDPVNFDTFSPTWSPLNAGTPGVDCNGEAGHCLASLSGIRKNIGSVQFTLSGSEPLTVLKP